jgi:hypothetical protein
LSAGPWSHFLCRSLANALAKAALGLPHIEPIKLSHSLGPLLSAENLTNLTSDDKTAGRWVVLPGRVGLGHLTST